MTNALSLTGNHAKDIQDFIRNLNDTYGSDLISAILYGSAASGEFIESNSNFNLLIVLNSTELGNLIKAKTFINKISFSRINPVFFTEEYLKSSLDVFPIEFLDMKENYSVLFGKDVLKDLNIDTSNLRFQCEQELKSKLINLKQQYLRINLKDKKALGNLLFKNFTSLMHIMRNLIRLKNVIPPYKKIDILRQATVEIQVPITNLLKILEAKNNPIALSAEEINTLIIAFCADLEKIIRIVDQL